MPDLRLGNVFQLPSRRISRRWTRSGTNLVIFLGALCAQTNLFWREMKIKKMYLKSNTRQENFRTFEERDILNGIKLDQLPAKKTSLRGIELPVKVICVPSCKETQGLHCKYPRQLHTIPYNFIIRNCTEPSRRLFFISIGAADFVTYDPRETFFPTPFCQENVIV